MCGIAGVFNYKTNQIVSSGVLKKMNNEIRHRGPDDEGYYVKNNVGLAFRRLSIIDLNTGNQPMHNENKTVWVIFNGEIYNFVELREDLVKQGHSFYTKSDTEVIVHLYEEYGADFPLYLNGMYSIALWDENKQTFFLVRDRPGIKPLYYAETNDGIMFASEIKALLKGGISNRPDHEAINQFLAYGYIPSPLTGFNEIRKLDAGNMLICSKGTCNLKEFWDLTHSDGPDSNMSEDVFLDVLVDELRNVLHRQTRSDVPIGIFLSGGIDSSLIASVAAEKCDIKLKAFSIGFAEDSYSELDNIRQVADKLGLELNEYILSESDICGEIERIMSFLDEPFFDYSAIPVYFVSKYAREQVKTVVGGEGGDELFGGYPTHYIYKITEPYRKMPRLLRSGIKRAVDSLPESHSYLSTSYMLKRFVYGAGYAYDEAHYRWKVLFDADEKNRLLNGDYLNSIKKLEPFSPMEKYFNKAREREFSIQDQLMYVDFKTFLQDDPLQKTDRMSMANSLEVRVPILDNAIIDLSKKVAVPKVRGFKTKYLLRKALSRFQSKEIAYGRKRGFTPPLAIWIKNGLKEYMMSSLSRESVNSLGMFNFNHVENIITDHLKGRAENSRPIWALVSLVNWYKNYAA